MDLLNPNIATKRIGLSYIRKELNYLGIYRSLAYVSEQNIYRPDLELLSAENVSGGTMRELVLDSLAADSVALPNTQKKIINHVIQLVIISARQSVRIAMARIQLIP